MRLLLFFIFGGSYLVALRTYFFFYVQGPLLMVLGEPYAVSGVEPGKSHEKQVP